MYYYIRTSKMCEEQNECEFGKTECLYKKDVHCANDGYFKLAFKVSLQDMDVIDQTIQHKVQDFYVCNEDGINIYNNAIVEAFVQHLRDIHINYTALSATQIYRLINYKSFINSVNWGEEFINSSHNPENAAAEDLISYDYELIEYEDTDLYIGQNDVSIKGFDKTKTLSEMIAIALAHKSIILIKNGGGKWYIKGIGKDYDMSKQRIEEHVGKYPRRKCWLIKYNA
jgi:hypothetical protein